MKLTKFAFTFAMLFSAITFADGSTFSPYMKVGAKGTITKSEIITEDSTLNNDSKEVEYNGKILPMIGIGMRRMEGRFATDISTEYAWLKESGQSMDYSYTVPKVMILASLFPKSFTSLYLGFGGSFAGVKIDDNEFHGLYGNASIGAEIFNLTDRAKGTIQLDMDVPAIAASSKGNRPYPLVALKLGLGF